MRVREIRLRVGRAGRGTDELRLCTGLPDPKKAPAMELAHVYAQRWHHELYDRER